ncbi:MAG: acyl-homoserine-lactone synthase [Xanthobacteraceae bacterium]|nr:acyl-homoserine-lactone synthase [Xanthobacteraceae bacterium]
MIRVIDRSNRDRFRRTLDQQFRMRRDVFVTERGWKDFDRGAYEMDQYDTEDAVYLVSLDAHDAVIGGMRLYPTLKPHLMSETFAHMVDGPIPQRSDIMELTRFALAAHARHSHTYCELFLGLLEYGLGEGLSGTMALMRTLRIPVIQNLGMTVRPLGLPQDIDGEAQTAVLIEMNEDSLARVRRSAGRSESVLETSLRGRASTS